MINKRSAAICGAAEVQRVTENAPSWPEVNTPIIGHGVGGYMDARRPTSVPITVVSKLLWKNYRRSLDAMHRRTDKRNILA